MTDQDARKNRQTLKAKFADGSFPSSADFASFIDSTLNLKDDGFSRSQADGFEIAQMDPKGKLLSFSWSAGGDALYSFKLDRARNLHLLGPDGGTILVLTRGPAGHETAETVSVGINVEHPDRDAALNVGGTIRSIGRIGVAPEREEIELDADGTWKDITADLRGCHGYEVIAGVGGAPNEGRYAMTHAIALNTYHPYGYLFNFLNLKRRVRVTSAYYRSRNEKIRLRWRCEKEHRKEKVRPYRLQIRTNGSCGEKIRIRCYLTRLWFDGSMDGSRATGTRMVPTVEPPSASSHG